MENIEEHFLSEIENFRFWAEDSPEEKRFEEWECNYPNWVEIYSTFDEFLQASEIENLGEADLNELLYIIAADNECEILTEKVAKHPDKLLFLSQIAIHSIYNNAKWQLASELGKIKTHKAEAEQLLFQFAKDQDEYTSRRALGALGKLGSSRLIEFVESAWATNHEYQRIMALSVLQRTDSPELEKYLLLAEQDGRKHLIYNASQIRSGHSR